MLIAQKMNERLIELIEDSTSSSASKVLLSGGIDVLLSIDPTS